MMFHIKDNAIKYRNASVFDLGRKGYRVQIVDRQKLTADVVLRTPSMVYSFLKSARFNAAAWAKHVDLRFQAQASDMCNVWYCFGAHSHNREHVRRAVDMAFELGVIGVAGRVYIRSVRVVVVGSPAHQVGVGA